MDKEINKKIITNVTKGQLNFLKTKKKRAQTPHIRHIIRGK